jgi:hypothetical protein
MLERLGKYEILETVAAGGQGTVYRARDSESGDVVALKVMHPGHTGEVQYLEALRQEANLASRLDHPNIVKVFDFQVEGGTAFVAMEYVPGVLRSEMRPGAPLPPGRAVELAIQVSSAMAHAHQHGVVHRDIKPQNILLTEDGTVKVTDFGIARAVQSSSIIRQTGVMGTPHYMSPEQWQGRAVDGRADVYSLGILLYEMLTGSPPFEGDGMGEIFRKHEQESVPQLPQELEVPEWLESVIRRALEKEASARFASAGEMLEALEQEVVIEGRTAILPVRVSKVPVAASVAGVGVFAVLALTAGVLAVTGQASGQVLGILVLIAGLAAIGGGAGLSKWRAFSGWWRGLAGVGALGMVIGVLTLVNPSMTGLSVGITTPVLTGAPVIITVLPDAASTLSSPLGEVVVELPAGTVERPTEFSYTALNTENVPARLEGFTLTDKVFDLSLMDTDGLLP